MGRVFYFFFSLVLLPQNVGPLQPLTLISDRQECICDQVLKETIFLWRAPKFQFGRNSRSMNLVKRGTDHSKCDFIQSTFFIMLLSVQYMNGPECMERGKHLTLGIRLVYLGGKYNKIHVYPQQRAMIYHNGTYRILFLFCPH